MRTQVFAYKGIIGIKSYAESTFLNDPQSCKLFLVNTNTVDISPEALVLLKKIKKGEDSIADIMAYKAGETNVFGWGGTLVKIITNKVVADKGYNPNTLTSTEGVKVEKSFMAYVDRLETDGNNCKCPACLVKKGIPEIVNNKMEHRFPLESFQIS